jgi:hypothetical protein
MAIGVAKPEIGLQVTFAWCINFDDLRVSMSLQEHRRVNLFDHSCFGREPPAPRNDDLYTLDSASKGWILRPHVRASLGGLNINRSDVAIDLSMGFLEEGGSVHRLSGPWLREAPLWTQPSPIQAEGWVSLQLMPLGDKPEGSVLIHAQFRFFKPASDYSLTHKVRL